MDTHAFLSSQGWRGTGHSLHKTDDTIGLSKPLLLNRKNNTKGLGQNPHFTSDQWWMNAFDEQLKGLDTSKEGKVVQTITTGKLNAIERVSLGKWALYTSFVRGGTLEGTLLQENGESPLSDESELDGKASAQEEKREGPNTATEEETKEERNARKEAKRKRKEERALKRQKRAEKAKRALEEEAKSSSQIKEAKRKSRRMRKEEKRLKRAAKEEQQQQQQKVEKKMKKKKPKD